jgi:hypothetical protein
MKSQSIGLQPNRNSVSRRIEMALLGLLIGIAISIALGAMVLALHSLSI